ncbi:MAG TPA: CBS domain-containing protein [Kofleriaceae bacterium]|nr:CBS domain-containing protein [Kofleriaceae bacterium]
MTPHPWSVQIDDAVTVAREMLAERAIHHLPVLDQRQLVGMVTERDLILAHNRIAATVEEVMTTAYRVDGEAPLEQVLDWMAERGSDAVVVTEPDGKPIGIFTAMDAIRVLRDLLRRRAA